MHAPLVSHALPSTGVSPLVLKARLDLSTQSVGAQPSLPANACDTKRSGAQRSAHRTHVTRHPRRMEAPRQAAASRRRQPPAMHSSMAGQRRVAGRGPGARLHRARGHVAQEGQVTQHVDDQRRAPDRALALQPALALVDRPGARRRPDQGQGLTAKATSVWSRFAQRAVVAVPSHCPHCPHCKLGSPACALLRRHAPWRGCRPQPFRRDCGVSRFLRALPGCRL